MRIATWNVIRAEGEAGLASLYLRDRGAFDRRMERGRQQLDRNQQMIKGRPPTRVYLLRGLLYCGDCGRRMHGIPTHGRRFYRCSGRDRLKGDARCLAVTVSADRVERVVWETIERGLKDPRLLMGKLQEHRTVARRGVEVRTEVAQLEADLARVRARRERLLDSMMEGDIQRAVFRDKLAELDSQERSLQEHLTCARAKLTQEQAQRAREDGALRFCRLAQRGLARLDDKGRQKLLGTLVEKAVMGGDRIELHTVLPTHAEGPPPPRRSRMFIIDPKRLLFGSIMNRSGSFSKSF